MIGRPPNAMAGGIENLAEGNTAFAMSLYARLRITEGILFFSPYSISTCLAMKRTITFTWLCGFCILSGCSSIASRTLEGLGPSPQPPLYFGGIRSDYQIVNAESSKDSWLWPGYCIIDTPFSFGIDVLFIPYDAYTACRWSERTHSGVNFATP